MNPLANIIIIFQILILLINIRTLLYHIVCLRSRYVRRRRHVEPIMYSRKYWTTKLYTETSFVL